MRIALLAGVAALIAAAPAPVDRLLPAKDASAIYAPAALPGTPQGDAIARSGFVQEEYLLSGTGNTYDMGADGRAVVRTANIPYTTRIVVVRPRDAKRYSGTVQLGFSHPQWGSNNWERIAPYVLRTGDMYVIVQVGGDPGTRQRSTPAAPVATPLILPWFDKARYAQFSWPDDGIRWDVIGQTVQRLRSGDLPAPLDRFRAKRLYMSGWSYLGSLQRSYIDYGFHDRYRLPDGKPAVDGYLIGISSNSVDAGFGPINPQAELPPKDQRFLRETDVPVIELMSENEARTNSLPQRPEVDSYVGGHRLYELGGVSHQDSGLPAWAQAWGMQLQAHGHTGWAPPFTCRTPATDVPMRDIAMAALDNLKLWRDRSIAPPKAERIAIASPGSASVDRFGNPQGGVRPVQLDLPLVRYGDPGAADCTGKANYLVRRRIAFDPATVRSAYPEGRALYLAKVRARLDALVVQRWLLRPDADEEHGRIAAEAETAFR